MFVYNKLAKHQVKKIIPEIKQIRSNQTLQIRHQVMWPNKPIDYVKLPNDKNARHFGLFINEELTSIISLFVENNVVQFRKFATLIEFQGLGYGTMLLKNMIDLLEKEGIEKLWCNARVGKSNFYEKFNLKTTGEKFEAGGIEYVIMEKTFTNKKLS